MFPYSSDFSTISKTLGEMWSGLSDKDKMVVYSTRCPKLDVVNERFVKFLNDDIAKKKMFEKYEKLLQYNASHIFSNKNSSVFHNFVIKSAYIQQVELLTFVKLTIL